MLHVETRDALFFALEEDPTDRVAMHALADWFFDHGDQQAGSCLRWAGQFARSPFRYSREGGLAVSGSSWHEGWYWWALEDPNLGRFWGHSLECRIPRKIWRQLRHSFPYTPAVFKEYPNVREAFEALIEAWPRNPARPFSPASPEIVR